MIKISERGKEESIDLVYLWVDGRDPEWLKKKEQATGKPFDESEENSQARYINNNELKYSLRSAEKNIPWVRKIFIVTDNQIPNWLKLPHPKVEIIDHSLILPLEILPCFNSTVLEYGLYRIPDLSNSFLLANDDMFFNTTLAPNFFFSEDGFPIVRLKKKPFGKWHNRIKHLRGEKLGQYADKLEKASLLIEKKFKEYYPGIPHHNVDAYNKENYQLAVEKIFEEEIKKSRPHKVRTFGDLHRFAFDLFALSINQAHLQYVSRKISRRIDLNKPDYEKYFSEDYPKLFCMNDTQNVTEEDRKRAQQFLEKKFPEKSSFEK